MFDFTNLPLRQKILLVLTLVIGISLFICSTFRLLETAILNTAIFCYALAVPLALLVGDTLIDLNDPSIFRLWLIFGIAIFSISLLGYDSNTYLIRRNHDINSTGINSFIIDYSTSSLKALIIFLGFYWIINRWFNKQGIYIVNTFRQMSWYNDVAKRKITWRDVLTNIFLFIIIMASILFGH